MGPGQRGSKKLLSCKTTHRTVACLLHDPLGADSVYSCRSLSAVAYRSLKLFAASIFAFPIWWRWDFINAQLDSHRHTNVKLLAVLLQVSSWFAREPCVCRPALKLPCVVCRLTKALFFSPPLGSAADRRRRWWTRSSIKENYLYQTWVTLKPRLLDDLQESVWNRTEQFYLT